MKVPEGYLTVSCQKCGKPIVFDPNTPSRFGVCPHCRSKTLLLNSENYHPPKDEFEGLMLAGFFCAFVCPPAGIVIGFILMAKNRVLAGMACLGIGLFMSAVVANFIFTGD